MKTSTLKIFTLGLVVTLVGCSTQSFNNQIQKDQFDLLAEESFMRYNTNRLSAMENPNKDFISQALVACHQKKFTKGLGLLEDKMHSHKTNPFYWNALGTCYSLQKETGKALFYYDLGLEAAKSKDLNERDRLLAEALISNNVGLIQLGFKRYNEAFDLFKKAVSIVPNFFTPEFNIAQLYIEFNENDKALEILKKLEMKNSEDIDLLYAMSLLYFRKNDLDKSYAYINRIQKDYLNRPDIVGLYAFNLMKKNRLEEAKLILEKRLFAPEYNQRNEMILDIVNQQIKELSKTQK